MLLPPLLGRPARVKESAEWTDKDRSMDPAVLRIGQQGWNCKEDGRDDRHQAHLKC
jgi:hypothetical protein